MTNNQISIYAVLVLVLLILIMAATTKLAFGWF
jgi:hypothetical protein